MIWTKAELLKTLERYEDEDTFAGALWTKEDVAYAVAEINTSGDYEVDPANIDAFHPIEFWDTYIDTLDQAYENDISWQNDELFTAVLEALKGEAS